MIGKKKIFALIGIVLALGLVIYYLTNRESYAYDPQACATNNDPLFSCWHDLYKGLVRKFGVETAISDLKKRAIENPMVNSQCHPLAHSIGQAGSERYQTVSVAFMHGDSYCWSGYYHGIMEGIVGRIGVENLPKEINNICADIPGKETYNFDYYNCVHGLGHGVMELEGDELFASLKDCDNLTGGWEKQSCYSGVFMENVIKYERFGFTKFLKKEEPMYPCTAVDDPYKYECYLGQTSFALDVTNRDFKKVAQLCTSTPGSYRDICYQSLGRDAANQANHQPDPTTSLCGFGTTQNDKNNCHIGAVKEFISYYHDDKIANEYCTLLNGATKDLCEQTSREYYKLF